MVGQPGPCLAKLGVAASRRWAGGRRPWLPGRPVRPACAAKVALALARRCLSAFLVGNYTGGLLRYRGAPYLVFLSARLGFLVYYRRQVPAPALRKAPIPLTYKAAYLGRRDCATNGTVPPTSDELTEDGGSNRVAHGPTPRPAALQGN